MVLLSTLKIVRETARYKAELQIIRNRSKK
jgi:hypothetical protein